MATATKERTPMSPYHEWPGFEHVYLEDSWLVGIQETPRILRFFVETFLQPEHPAWHPPRPGEQYCYADMEITFHEVTEYAWKAHSMKVTQGLPNERADYGNVDYLCREEGAYLLGGDWGELRIECRSVTIARQEFGF